MILCHQLSLFSFTTDKKKRKAEQDLERYSAAEHRREVRESVETNLTLYDLETADLNDSNECSDEQTAIVYPSNTECIDTQTDLTMTSLTALEFDYQQRMIEISQHQYSTKGYPDEDDLKDNKELLRFYTGLHSFTVLMSLFTIVATPISETTISKLSKFQCFILTIMKLCLNSSNYDLGFRFGISESTVSRVFTRWIEAMDIRLSF